MQIADLPMQYAAAKGVEVLDVELDVVVHEPRLKFSVMPHHCLTSRENPEAASFLDITERKRVEEQERFS